GYSGSELARLLERHPSVSLVLLDRRQADGADPESHHVPWTTTAAADNKLDVVFTATPPEVSMGVIPQVLSQGARAIDLSGAFRLSPAQYRRWYGGEHAHPELLDQAVYGLPELYRERVRTARLVANPGCYSTAAICALWPLVQQDWINRTAGVICDAKSGVSGAGKTPSPKTHFMQVSENFSAYAVLRHRHVPEVLNSVGLQEDEFAFTAHLLPIQRGILATHYLRLKRAVKSGEVLDLYRTAYAQARFIRLYTDGQPQVSAVNRTNFCDIHCSLGQDSLRLVVISCIDNLVKGAAGQAVQNMNLMFGLDEAEGLL
ncbi:MAG: N-acetyl-gamma-glutamyl-phosphate reductase, partial [Acidobacteria bacterium]|nr:N-acetyl-gamma-glutamyl-phosphate reductase [Acidobacteriota bacterium]